MLKVGDTVNYHSIIGGPATSEGHKILHIEQEPNNFGCDVAWISGKSGCVAMSALSNDAHPHPEKKPITRSQRRYRAYLASESVESFGDWLKNSYWDDYRKRKGV